MDGEIEILTNFVKAGGRVLYSDTSLMVTGSRHSTAIVGSMVRALTVFRPRPLGKAVSDCVFIPHKQLPDAQSVFSLTDTFVQLFA